MEKKEQVIQESVPSISEGSDTSYNKIDSPGTSSEPTTFWGKAIKFCEVDDTEGLSAKQLFLYNYDLKPVEAKRRTWRWWNFVCFWIADSFNINTWQIASTGVVAGLSPWATWGTVWLGYTFCAIFVTLSAQIGIYTHCSFPVASRAPFGIWGSLWPVFNRVVMACVWFGVQSYIGGQCMQLMLRAIFSNKLDGIKIPNKIPLSENISSFGMLSFFLFWFFQLPFCYMHPHTVRHLFTAKAIITPCAGIAFLIWTLVKADGGGPVVKQGNTIHGSEYSWAFINSMMNSLANFATLIVNAPDFSRMAHTPKSATLSQLITLPVSFSLTCLIGILVSSASTVLYGETYWDPLDVLSHFLDTYKSGSRAGVFFIAFGFMVAQIGTNISANSLSAGTDMTALLPKFINIRRGSFICAAVGFAICPWKLMSSSSVFTTCLSAYSVFLSAIAGTIYADVFVCRRGYMILRDLYIGDHTSVYFYWHGINPRAYVAYIAGILPNIVGFVGATGTHTVPDGATKLYYFSFFTGLAASILVYVILVSIFPIRGMPCKLTEKGWYGKWQDVEDFDEFFLQNRQGAGAAGGQAGNVLSRQKSILSEDDVHDGVYQVIVGNKSTV